MIIELNGPNGGGKSSLLLKIAQGDFSGIPAQLSSRLAIQRNRNVKRSLLLQSFSPIFSSSVKSILLIPLVYAGNSPRVAEDQAVQLLTTFRFERLLDRQYFTLSGGERRFVALFSVLLWRAELCVLDDPFTMLDKLRADRALSLLQTFTRDDGPATTLISSASPITGAPWAPSERVHVGYCPDSYTCAVELARVLKLNACSPSAQLSLEIRGITLAPFGRTLLANGTADLGGPTPILITGDNGDGKTILLRTIAGIYRPNSGDIRLSVNGLDLQISPGKNCFYLPQDHSGLLAFGSVDSELVTLAAPKWWRAFVSALYQLRILKDSDTVREASFGEVRFRAFLSLIAAAATSGRTDLCFLLDEPDAALDELRYAALVVLLRHLASQGWPVVVVTHRPDIYDGPNQAGPPLLRYQLSEGRIYRAER